MLKFINTFNDIALTKENPLVLCDIDETILTYKYDIIDFFNRHKLISPDAPFEEIKQYALDDYYIYRILNNPSHTDQKGFKTLLEQIEKLNGEIIFITARSIGSTEMTKKHFKILNIDYKKYKIHYLSNLIQKGEFIKKNICMKENQEVIFIDDMGDNIENVKLLNPNIKCYQFIYER